MNEISARFAKGKIEDMMKYDNGGKGQQSLMAQMFHTNMIFERLIGTKPGEIREITQWRNESKSDVNIMKEVSAWYV